jgi:prolyl-tRNA synthetase
VSQEFQVIAATGEDAIVYCPDSDYAANMEKAEALAPRARAGRRAADDEGPTPGKSTCDDVAELLNVPLETTVKSLVLATDSSTTRRARRHAGLAAAAARRPRHERDQGRQGAGPGRGLPLRHRAEIEAHFGTKPGYLGPIGLKQPVKIVADREVAVMADWICGANEEDFHITGVNWGRDLPSRTRWRTCAMCRGRPVAGRQGPCSRSSGASRSGMCSTSAPSTASR